MDKFGRDAARDTTIDEGDIRGELLALPKAILAWETLTMLAEQRHRSAQDLVDRVETDVRIEWWEKQCAVDLLESFVTRDQNVATARLDERAAGAAYGEMMAVLEAVRSKRDCLLALVNAGLHERPRAATAGEAD